MAHRPDDQVQTRGADLAIPPIEASAAVRRRRRDMPARPEREWRADRDRRIVARFTEQLIAPDTLGRSRDGLVAELLGNGWSVEAIVADLFVPAARLLGEDWLEDRASFIDVTIATQRLIVALTDLERAHPPSVRPPRGAILLAPAPDDQHGFGLLVLSFFLRRAGWSVTTKIAGPRAELIERVRSAHWDVVGLSVGHTRSVEPLADLVAALRTASRNPALLIGVGGPAILADPGRVRKVGADLTAGDARELVAELEDSFGSTLV